MRATGLVDDVGRCGPHDHVCWAFDAPAEFRDRAVDFLADGLRRGLRVRYVARGDIAALRADLRELVDVPGADRPGAVDATSVDATYGDREVVDPDAQITAYVAATRDALGAGHRGLRVAADVTTLVRTPEQLDAFARYEHRIDRRMATEPFSALCGYDRSEVGPGTVEQVACLHPGTNTDAQFRLHGSATAAAALGGELDLATRRAFAQALERADPRPTDGEIVIDATALQYVDQRGLLALAELAERRRCTVVLRTRRSGPGRLVAALGLTRVRVERIPAA